MSDSITSRESTIKTPDGECEAAFIHPAKNAGAGVILWPDAFGLRDVMREFGRRLAADGYTVLIPNPFYRVTHKLPIVAEPQKFNFETDFPKIYPFVSSITAPGAAERDALAFVEFLDSQPQVDKSKKVGTQGYCMGGQLALRSAAASPGRIGAVASFHGGHLVTDQPSSPHLQAPKIRAKVYIAIAANDDAREPDAKEKLKTAFSNAGNPAEIEVYLGAMHGWCVPDMPNYPTPIYKPDDAERAWNKLRALYDGALS